MHQPVKNGDQKLGKIIWLWFFSEMRHSTGSVFGGYNTQTNQTIYSKSNFDSNSTESKVMPRVGFVHILNSLLCQMGLKKGAIT